MDAPLLCVASAELGKAWRIDDAAGRYIEFCKSTFPSELDLRGLRIVVDCAHGAGYHVAPPVFHELGAEVIAIGNEPDGLNINAGLGATHPARLQEAVLLHGADLGIALDGDGDRLVMVDREGRLYDGDQLLYVIAMDYRRRGVLAGGVIGTLMSNLGLEQALAREGIPLERAAVGDRYVLEKLLQNGWQLGGENSGHHHLSRPAHHRRRDHRRARGAARVEGAAHDARRRRRAGDAVPAAAHQRPDAEGFRLERQRIRFARPRRPRGRRWALRGASCSAPRGRSPCCA